MNKEYVTYDIIELEGESPLSLVKKTQEAIIKYGADNITFEVDYSEEYGSITTEACLQCKRPMTKEEKEKEIKKEKERQQRDADWALKQYEMLKIKLGK